MRLERRPSGMAKHEKISFSEVESYSTNGTTNHFSFQNMPIKAVASRHFTFVTYRYMLLMYRLSLPLLLIVAQVQHDGVQLQAGAHLRDAAG